MERNFYLIAFKKRKSWRSDSFCQKCLSSKSNCLAKDTRGRKINKTVVGRTSVGEVLIHASIGDISPHEPHFNSQLLLPVHYLHDFRDLNFISVHHLFIRYFTAFPAKPLYTRIRYGEILSAIFCKTVNPTKTLCCQHPQLSHFLLFSTVVLRAKKRRDK